MSSHCDRQASVRKARAALRAETRRIVAEIRTLIEPFLRPSGYFRDNNPFGCKERLRIAVFPEHRGTRFRKVGTANVEETMGFTEDGVIVDQYCAIVTTDWSALSLAVTRRSSSTPSNSSPSGLTYGAAAAIHRTAR